MKKIFIIAMMAAVVLSAACTKSEIMTYGDQRYIYLDLEEANTGLFSFSFISTNERRVKLPIPLKISGKQLTADALYSIQIDTKKSTLKQGEYLLPETMLFHKESFCDTLWVELIYSERMATEALTLAFDLRPNDNFLTREGFTTASLSVSGIEARPDWWTAAVETNYLGSYSNKKFRLFREHVFVGDFGKLSGDEKLYHTLKFRDYLRDNPTFEDETGVRMWVSNQFV